MTDTLEWKERSGGEWSLMDTRNPLLPDTRILMGTGKEVVFYLTYARADYNIITKPEGMSIDQIKDWALSQFLLIRES